MNFGTSALDFSVLPYVEGVNPPVTKPNPAFLADITEEGMRSLFTRFYTALFESSIQDIFPQDKDEMMVASQHSADFFIQISGGRAYFNENRGAPQMRKRHAPFKITPNARLVWLEEFKKALEPIILNKQSSDANIQSMWNYVNIFSQWMVNSKD